MAKKVVDGGLLSEDNRKKKKYRGTQEGFDIDANVEEVKRKTRLVLC